MAILKCRECGKDFHALPPIETADDETCLICLRDEDTDGPDDRVEEPPK